MCKNRTPIGVSFWTFTSSGSLAKECYLMKLDLLTNATVVDDAIRFVSSNKSKDNLKSSPSNSNEDEKELNEPEYNEDKDQLEEEETGEMTNDQVF